MKYKTNIHVEGNKFIQVSVWYDLGGMNYFTYKIEKRGIYVSIDPITCDECFESYEAFSGVKYFLLEMKRKNEKKTEQVWKMIEPLSNELATAFRDSKHNPKIGEILMNVAKSI